MTRLLICALVACADVGFDASDQPLTAPGSCATAAIPGDGIDDRVAIQSALDAQGCADLPSGTFDIVTLNTGIYQDIIKLYAGRQLSGAGPSTVLRFTGDAGQHDWRGITVVADDVEISGVTLDTSALVNTEEQTHVVHVSGPAERFRISGVWFRHPERGPSPGPLAGGDCIKIVGYETHSAMSGVIVGNHFIECDRSGVASIGGFRGLVIANNIFHSTGDQDIDLEGDGTGRGLVISANIFRTKPGAQGSTAISLGINELDDYAVTGNVLEGRGIYAYNARRGTIGGNFIDQTTGSSPTINVIKVSELLTVTGNTMSRRAPAAYGSILNVSSHHTGSPGAVVVSGNLFHNETAPTSVAVTSARSVAIAGNTFEYVTTAPTDGAMVFIEGTTQRTRVATVTGNVFSGPAPRTVRISNNGLGVGPVALVGNAASGTTYGINCSGNAGPIVSVGNNWPAPQANSCPMSGGN